MCEKSSWLLEADLEEVNKKLAITRPTSAGRYQILEEQLSTIRDRMKSNQSTEQIPHYAKIFLRRMNLIGNTAQAQSNRNIGKSSIVKVKLRGHKQRTPSEVNDYNKVRHRPHRLETPSTHFQPSSELTKVVPTHNHSGTDLKSSAAFNGV